MTCCDRCGVVDRPSSVVVTFGLHVVPHRDYPDRGITKEIANIDLCADCQKVLGNELVKLLDGMRKARVVA